MFIFRHMFTLFMLVAVAEVIAFIFIGDLIGLGWTICTVMLTAAIGVSMLRVQGFDVITRIQQASASGRIPGTELIEGVLLLIAGALLLTPGFLTDIVGFLLLLKPSRLVLAKRVLKSGLDSYLKGSTNGFYSSYAAYSSQPRQATAKTSDVSHSNNESDTFNTANNAANISKLYEQLQQQQRPVNGHTVIEGEFEIKQSDQAASNDSTHRN